MTRIGCRGRLVNGQIRRRCVHHGCRGEVGEVERV
jgi:hypothetical protein